MTRSAVRFTGVIDTLSAGYGVVNRHPWIVVIPLLVDLFLWLGPQVSAGRLVSRTLGQLNQLGAEVGALDVAAQQEAQRDLVQAAESFNLLSGLAPSFVGVPSLVAALGVRDPFRSLPAESWGVALLLFFGSALGGMLLGSLFYSALAQHVRGSVVEPGRLVSQALEAWTRLLLYLLLLVGLGLLFGLPLGFLAVGAALVSPALGSLAASALLLAAVWVGFYLFFVPDAIFVSRVGPLRAVKDSVAVVRLNLGSAFVLVVLVTLVMLGMGRVWEVVALHVTGPLGMGLGIVGNAYIASGLIAASMIFYRERIEHLRGSLQRTATDQLSATGGQ